MRAIIALFILLFSLPAFALDMQDFKTLPVLHEGRLKPLDSFARAELKTFSGSEKLKDKAAIEWLAETLFTPATAITQPVFKVENTNLRHSLGLGDKDNFIYSFEEIAPGLRKTSPAVTALLKRDAKDLTQEQKNLLDIHDKAFAYTDLLRSLSLLLPLNINLPDKYASSASQNLSWLELKKLEQNLDADVKKIITRKGENFESYSADEKNITVLSFQLKLMASAASNSNVFKIIPPQWQDDKGNWHAPWELLQKGEGSPETAKLFEQWRALGKAYNANDSTIWQSAAVSILETNKSQLFRLKLEVWQNTIQPAKTTTAFYIISLIGALLFLTFNNKITYRIGLAALSLGLVIQFLNLGIRSYLLARPPVGTLYESLLFVSMIAVALSLIVEKYLRNGSGLLIGALSGVGLGLISFSFAGDGDTMTMLTAVLNTNFWLATHVLCITMGYGWCILTAILAHLYLASEKFRGEAQLFTLHTLTIFALLFTAIGTILGGIWADQSWGRFWGWDPKENGALLIVLWLIWLLHGKLGKQLNSTQFIAGLAFTNVIVALSWIGVNLLGVGMHSYGFADGLYYGLGGFILAELALIGCLWKRPRIFKNA